MAALATGFLLYKGGEEKDMLENSIAPEHPTSVLQALTPDDFELRGQIRTIVTGCADGDLLCYLNKIHRYVALNIQTLPLDSEGKVRFPLETLSEGKGDTRSRAVLAVSMLMNAGIDAKLGGTEDIPKVYACGLPLAALAEHIRKEAESHPVLERSLDIPSGKLWSAIPKLGSNPRRVEMRIASNVPVDMKVFLTSADLKAFTGDEGYMLNDGCTRDGVINASWLCTIEPGNTLMIGSPADNATVQVQMFSTGALAEEINRYKVDGKECILLDIGSRDLFIYPGRSPEEPSPFDNASDNVSMR